MLALALATGGVIIRRYAEVGFGSIMMDRLTEVVRLLIDGQLSSMMAGCR
jgi:hypothetical protein